MCVDCSCYWIAFCCKLGFSFHQCHHISWNMKSTARSYILKTLLNSNRLHSHHIALYLRRLKLKHYKATSKARIATNRSYCLLLKRKCPLQIKFGEVFWWENIGNPMVFFCTTWLERKHLVLLLPTQFDEISSATVKWTKDSLVFFWFSENGL